MTTLVAMALVAIAIVGVKTISDEKYSEKIKVEILKKDIEEPEKNVEEAIKILKGSNLASYQTDDY
jgi:hypothetical protein